jgi:valyl-tRNA synthetase
MLDKTFDPKSVEPRLYEMWETSGRFAPVDDPTAEPFSIVIPPPNVTGNLHIGHALNNTLQDVLIRYHRMTGKAALWLPGTDHAGIATQMVVERQLAAEGNISRRDMGREAFVEKIWEWKAQSGDAIVNQLRRLGASCDWSRERFTLDEGLSAAVRKVFVQLYKEGLIYRGKRLVNWDPKFETAISDLEVESIEVDGHMWHFKYPLAGGETYEYVERDADGQIVLQETRDYISIATTRPETMLGDGAVAVHLDDERYRPIVGKLCEIPVGPREHRRLIPIIVDEYPDPEFGSGAVKITGAHDFNDYQVARRNGIPCYRLMDVKGAMRDDGDSYAECAQQVAGYQARGETLDEGIVDGINLVPDDYRGLDRFDARKKVIAAINAEGLAVMTVDAEGNPIPLVDKKKIMQPFGDRSGVVIEPMLTDQWYVDAKTLAQPAIAAVESGATVFEPKSWDKTYFEWLRNIEPWCISRQLWWGHRIPAWYDEDGNIYVEETQAQAVAAAGGKPLIQDEDVLDTWFSSGLWPFSTLGWPGESEDVKRFYPTNTLVTGFDIIFFWVARMMMMGLHFMGEVPFRRVFINALVRDASGAKMSKSKGNVMDPLDLVDEYGADALRFTLTAMSGQARDIKLAKPRIEGYRNFGTKLWNASRFCEMNGCARVDGFDPAGVQQPINRWVRGETVRTVAAVTAALETCAFDEVANTLYRFIWNVVCDWYVELAKPILNGSDEAARDETRAMVAWTLDQCMKLLHPVMPFITEELWARTGETGPARDSMLMVAQWPILPQSWIDADAAAQIDLIIAAVSEGRSVRSELNVPAGARPMLLVVEASPEQARVLTANAAVIAQTLRAAGVEQVAGLPDGAIPFVVDGATLALPVADFIDLAAEKARLAKEVGNLAADAERTAKKLDNADFVARAKPEVVEETREKLNEARAAKARLEAALTRLNAVGN